jgi:two-component system response regulator DevR
VLSAPLRIMLVDDHEVVRAGIRMLLDGAEDLIVCAEATSAREAVDLAARVLPDVVLMDVRLRDSSGIETTREIRAQRPETKVLMLTSSGDQDELLASIMAGAAGYLLKQTERLDLVESIRAVGQGKSLLDPSVTEGVLEQLRSGKQRRKDKRLARLSPNEERILAMVAEGRTNRQIGEELHLTEKTVKNYVSSILAKLEVGRRTEAVAYLVRHSGQQRF